MEQFLLALMLFMTTCITTFLLMIMIWYNGVLEVKMDEDGDNLKLNINEYDMIRKRKFMIIFIKRK